MKNILNITNSGEQLISSIDDGTNQLIINDSVIPESQYIGSGTYSATISGHNITITKTTGSNIMLIRNSEYNYSLVDVPSVTNQIVNVVYPVGSYYETSDTSFNPNVSFGGLWIEEVQGQVHISAGSSYSVSGALTNHSDGGNKDAIIPYHKHGVDITNTGSHSHYTSQGNGKEWFVTSENDHAVNILVNATSGASHKVDSSTASLPYHHRVTTGSSSLKVKGDTAYSGSTTTNANMQPYIIVKRWHRVG